MSITTIAVTEALNIRSILTDGTVEYWVDPQYAPIWTDGTTNYLVSSGNYNELLQSTSPVEAEPNRVNIVVDMDGLSALALMNLTVVPQEL
jgi:hypothetical protein